MFRNAVDRDVLETQWRIVRRDSSDLYQELVERAAGHPTVGTFFATLGHSLRLMPDSPTC